MYPSMDEWVKKICVCVYNYYVCISYMYIMKCYLVIKKKEILPAVTTWMNLEGVMLIMTK